MKKYPKIKHTYQRVLKFILNDIWHLDMSELSIMKARMVRYLKVFIITIRGVGADKIGMQATTLSFFSLMAVVPFVAMVFTITNGFGLGKRLEALIYTYFSGNEETINYILKFANNVISTSQNGLFGIISFVIYLWTVIWLMLSVEKCFNDIWKVGNRRSFGKKITFYLILLAVAPFIIMAFLTLAVLYINTMQSLSLGINNYIPISSLFTWIIFYVLVATLFTLIYRFIPNTKVKVSAAFNSSVIVSFAFIVVQFFYLETQIMVSGLNAVYGVFAAIPLFLIWMNISWTLILFGTELSHAFQNVDNYKFKE